MSEQMQTTSKIIDVISEHDNRRWIMLLNDRHRTVELLPVYESPGTDKKLVLWAQRETIHLDGLTEHNILASKQTYTVIT